jgi:hypothetical protein
MFTTLAHHSLGTSAFGAYEFAENVVLMMKERLQRIATARRRVSRRCRRRQPSM